MDSFTDQDLDRLRFEYNLDLSQVTNQNELARALKNMSGKGVKKNSYKLNETLAQRSDDIWDKFEMGRREVKIRYNMPLPVPEFEVLPEEIEKVEVIRYPTLAQELEILDEEDKQFWLERGESLTPERMREIGIDRKRYPVDYIQEFYGLDSPTAISKIKELEDYTGKALIK